MSDREASFDVIAHDRATSTLDKVGGGFGKLGRLAGGVGKTVALGIGTVAAGGVAALGAAMVQGVKDAASYQTLAAKTAAVLKSTGNVAGTSVKHIQELAGSLESLSGVDEELIINSQNVLATFTDIRNEAGKGNDIFDQAAKAALNMSTALGTDLQGSTIQLGKALNDPIKGISALSRVGVSFTQKQKDTIKSLVESGDKMAAQKVILAELNKEFGGAAEAAGSGFNGSLARLQDTLGDTGRALGEKLLPHITDLFNWLNDKLPKAFAWIQDIWESVSTAFSTKNPFGRFTDGAFKAQRLGYTLRVIWDKVVVAGKFLWEVAGKVGRYFTDVLNPAVRDTIEDVMPLLKAALDNVRSAFKSSGKSTTDWGAIFHTVGQVIKIAVQAVIIVVAAVALAVSKNIQTMKWALDNVLGPAFKFMAKSALTQFGIIINAAAGAFGWVPGIGPKLRTAAKKFNEFAASVNRALAGIHAKPVYVPIVLTGSGAKIRGIQNKINANPSKYGVGGYATGGFPGAGELAMVGEEGPELVRFGARAQVYNARQTSRMLGRGRGGGAGPQVIVNQHFHASVMAEREALAFLDKARQQAALAGTYVTAGTG